MKGFNWGYPIHINPPAQPKKQAPAPADKTIKPVLKRPVKTVIIVPKKRGGGQ